MKRYMPATGSASLLISERTVIRQMMNLKFLTTYLIKQLIQEFQLYRTLLLSINRMDDTFWLVTTCKVIQDSLDSFVGILDSHGTWILDSNRWRDFPDSLSFRFRTPKSWIPDYTSENMSDS